MQGSSFSTLIFDKMYQFTHLITVNIPLPMLGIIRSLNILEFSHYKLVFHNFCRFSLPKEPFLDPFP